MARKSIIQIEGESALRNLLDVHSMELENYSNGQPYGATYHRNAADCSRWCASLRKAGIDYPDFMMKGNIRYFAAIWRISV